MLPLYIDAAVNSNSSASTATVWKLSTGDRQRNPVAGSGNALDFDGINDFCNLGNNAVYQLKNSFTIEAWIYTRTVDAGVRRIISSRNASTSNGIGFGLNGNKLRFTTFGVLDYNGQSGLISANTWTHVAVVFNTGNDAQFYINGVLSETIAGSASPGTNGINMYIGQIGTSGGEYFNGLIDEVRFWNCERTESEIKNNMYEALNGNESNLIGYYRMDNSTGTLLDDYSSNHNNGTLINMDDVDWVASDAWKYRSTTDLTSLVHCAGYDPDGQSISSKKITDPIKGIVMCNGKEVTYIPALGTNGAYTYSYQVSDGTGADTFTMCVTVTKVTMVPTITMQPKSDTVMQGESCTFTFGATGVPSPGFQWQKDGVIIPNAVNSFYTISSVTLSDAGTYKALATNALGSDTSNPALLVVYDSILIATQPQPDTVLAQSTAVFTVVSKGSTGYTFQWQKLAGSAAGSIPGATSDTLAFTAVAGDNSSFYRCIVSCGPVSDTSAYAKLTIVTVPVLTVSLPVDTAVATGGSITFMASAQSEPPAQYFWYVYYSASSDTFAVDTGSTLTFTNITKQKNGFYFFVADNGYVSAASTVMYLHIIDPVCIDIDLPSRYMCVQGGTAVMSPGVSGGGTSLYYQWFCNGLPVIGETDKALRINHVDSSVHNGNRYQCEIWNTYQGLVISIAKTGVCTLVVGKYSNPFKMKAERVDMHNTSRVRLKFWSVVDLKTFPSSQGCGPWADSVWIMYKSINYADDIAGAAVAFFSTERIKKAAPDTLSDTITVGALPAKNDSCFWFSYSVRWHDPALQIDTLLKPFTNANKVFMIDTILSPNHLALRGEYIMFSDSVRIIIDSLKTLNSATDSLVVIRCSRYPQFNQPAFDTAISVSHLLNSGTRDTVIWDSVAAFPVELDTVYCRWFVVNRNSVTGTARDTSFTIGWPRPEYPGTLTADSTPFGGELKLNWDPPDSAADSMRVWWDNDTIPLTHSFQLPVSQSHRFDPAMKCDTIRNLNNKTFYCVGLQIFRNGMWSAVTQKSRTWAKTALGDTSRVPNCISVDTSWFDNMTNSIIIHWHVDTLEASGERSFETGYVVSLDSLKVIDTSQMVTNWQRITAKTAVTTIPIFPDIIFDTSYTAGLWLRSYSPLTGPGKKSPPTDSSMVEAAVPPFTWQFITFFPDTVDTVYAANKKIILGKLYEFTTFDTLCLFEPPDIPDGFVRVGGVYFNFGNKLNSIPPTLLGLKYDSLPVGVTLDKLALYQYKEGQLHARHGSTVRSGAVWDTINSPDLAYPFLVLADTVPPAITIVDYFSDTVNDGENVTTSFGIRDNSANVQWRFQYGPGHEGYRYGRENHLTACMDTALQEIIPYKKEIINKSFGLRARIIASDGVNADTLNVSRCVRSDTTGLFSVNAREWAPLHTAANLDNTDLAAIFSNSITTPEPWKYSVYDYRLYRWYDNTNSGINDWVEYSDEVKEVFNLVPGRLIWFKSAENRVLCFGAGVTPSLKEPYTIILKPMNWTDISLPFQFDIMLRDVLESTGPAQSKYLDVYQWRKEGQAYNATDLYIAKIDSIVDAVDTIKAQQNINGYTMYNHKTTPIILRIPPTCLALSEYSAGVKRPVNRSEHAWNISLRWKINTAADGPFRRIRCGYRENIAPEQQFGILPPSMSKVNVGILDTGTNRLCGWALQPSIREGGIAFEVCFSNQENTTAEIEYYLDNLDGLPEGFMAQAFNSQTSRYEQGTSENKVPIQIPAGTTIRRIVVIGNDEFMSCLKSGYLPMKLVKTFPNPFTNRFILHYRIPSSITEVQFTLFTIRGQQIWKGIEQKHLTPGEHRFLFDSESNAEKGVLPAGVYVMRMTAKNKAGKVIYGGNKRLTCIK